MNLRDITIRNALLYPDKEALVFNERRVSHQEFAGRGFRLANALIGLGLRPQERVAMLAPNCSEYLEVFCACESANLVIVNMNHRLSSPELIQIVLDCEPAALIFHEQFRELAEYLIAAHPGFRRLICIEGTRQGAAAYEDLLRSAPDTPPQVAIRDSDVAYLIYTSGTTGRPKGVMLSHKAVVESARCISHEGGAHCSDIMLIVMPMFHIGGRIEQLAYTIVGATIVLHAAFDAGVVLRSIDTERVTSAHLAPIMVQRLLDSPDLNAVDKSTLHTIHYASAPMPVPTLQRAIAAFGPILTQVYGMTENIVATLLTPAQHIMSGTHAEVRRLGSAGQPFLTCKIRIVRPDDSDVDIGEIGEILVQGPGVMNGYWNNNTATSNALRNGWFYTGDLGMFDSDHFVFVIDRKKDMIISGGENIYSWEVEEALRSHAAIAEAAVIGVPDPEWGEAVKAFVVTRNVVSAEDLIAHCRAKIASYKKPKSIEFVAALPRLFNGKIDKKALRAPFWADATRQVS
jgi:acyl-CoA synthetase (AMP-forming)/AMP-acid ligase II